MASLKEDARDTTEALQETSSHMEYSPLERGEGGERETDRQTETVTGRDNDRQRQ